jgi:ABC-type amino acid transport substrate-binding protein
VSQFRCALQSVGQIILLALLLLPAGVLLAADLEEVRRAGVLRHLGVPYANFVTGSGDGLDVELISMFARHLGVEYRFVETNWRDALSDVSGKRYSVREGEVEFAGEAPVRGDLIANGLTVLAWRTQLIDYSEPTFPSGVWLIARAEDELQPIVASGNEQQDIDRVKALLGGRELMGVENTCLDPRLYRLAETGARISLHEDLSNLVDLVPILLSGASETALLDVPDALLALQKWPGQIKVIGPVSEAQRMAVGFAKESPALRRAFNDFLRQIVVDGRYLALVRKYYPSVTHYFKDFFES